MGSTNKSSPQSSSYSQSGVDYSKLDRLKVLAQQSAAQTSQNIEGTQFKEIPASRGESAYLLERHSYYLATVQEGLGTKSLVADEVRKFTGKTHYDALAQDTVAMITNDLITVGAKPLSVLQYLAVAESTWLDDEERMSDLVNGWRMACDNICATWGGGETPSLKGIIQAGTVDLAGSAVGIVEPKSRVLLGLKIQPGDIMIAFASSGIHANGLSLARATADFLPDRYQTKLTSGISFGEALLIPTTLYSPLLQELFEQNIELHYAVNVTGHGWRKLMRPTQSFLYQVETVPEIPEIFTFLQEKNNMSDQDMYATFNMGIGFVVYVAVKDAERALAIANTHLQAWQLGTIQTATTSSIVIAPKNIVYQSDDLNIRI